MENINDATYAPEAEETISDADMAAFDEVWALMKTFRPQMRIPILLPPMMQPTAAKAVRRSKNPQRTASPKRSRRRTKRKRDTNSTR